MKALIFPWEATVSGNQCLFDLIPKSVILPFSLRVSLVWNGTIPGSLSPSPVSMLWYCQETAWCCMWSVLSWACMSPCSTSWPCWPSLTCAWGCPQCTRCWGSCGAQPGDWSGCLHCPNLLCSWSILHGVWSPSRHGLWSLYCNLQSSKIHMYPHQYQNHQHQCGHFREEFPVHYCSHCPPKVFPLLPTPNPFPLLLLAPGPTPAGLLWHLLQ